MIRILIAVLLFGLVGTSVAEDRRVAMGDLVGRWVVVDPGRGEVVYEFTMTGLMVEEAGGGEQMRRYYLDEGRLIVHEGPGAEQQWRVLDKAEGRIVLHTPSNKRLELSRLF